MTNERREMKNLGVPGTGRVWSWSNFHIIDTFAGGYEHVYMSATWTFIDQVKTELRKHLTDSQRIISLTSTTATASYIDE